MNFLRALGVIGGVISLFIVLYYVIVWYIKGHFGRYWFYFWFHTVVWIGASYYEKSKEPESHSQYKYWSDETQNY